MRACRSVKSRRLPRALASGRRDFASRLGLLVISTVLVGIPSVAFAEQPPWTDAQFKYFADHKDVKDVLRDFAASEHIVAAVSTQVQGTLSGKFEESPELFLNRLTATFGLTWFYDGHVLHVHSAGETINATQTLGTVRGDDFKRALKEAASGRFTIRSGDRRRRAHLFSIRSTRPGRSNFRIGALIGG